MDYEYEKGIGPTIEGWVRQNFRDIDDLSRVFLQVEMNNTIHKGVCTSEISISHKKKPCDSLSPANYQSTYTISDFVEADTNLELRRKKQDLLRDMVAKGIPGKILPVKADWDLKEILMVASQTLADMYRDSPAADKAIERHNERAEQFYDIHQNLTKIEASARREEWEEKKTNYAVLGQLEFLLHQLVQAYEGSDAARASQKKSVQFADDISFLAGGIEMFEDCLPQAVIETFKEIALPVETDGMYFTNDRTDVAFKHFMEWAEKYCSADDKAEAEDLRAKLDLVYSDGLCKTYRPGQMPQDAFIQIEDLLESAIRIQKAGGGKSINLYVDGLWKLTRKAEDSRGFVPRYVTDQFVKIIEPENNIFSADPEGDWIIRDNTIGLLEAYREWGKAYCELGTSGDFERVRELKAGLDSLFEESMPVSVRQMYTPAEVPATTSPVPVEAG